VSTLDVTGSGAFSLITGLAGTAWSAAADKLDLPFLRTLVIGAPSAVDGYHDWHRAREIEEAGAILVRPDGYVAWRHVAAVWDEEEALHQLKHALESVLGKPW
jgi:2,4-dichlorophenol 6-monooxygenase